MKQLLTAVLVVGLIGCGATASSTPRGSANEIARAEIEAASGVSTAQDIVQRLRPQWLRVRGSGTLSNSAEEGIVVYVDGTRSGQIRIEAGRAAGPNPLDGIAASEVERLIYYSASSATQRFGTGHAQGAIEVITR